MNLLHGLLLGLLLSTASLAAPCPDDAVKDATLPVNAANPPVVTPVTPVDVAVPAIDSEPIENFLAMCQTESYMMCMKLFSEIDQTLYPDVLKLAMANSNFWATEVILYVLRSTEGHFEIQHLLEDYIQAGTPDLGIVTLVLQYSKWDPTFDKGKLLELSISREDKDDYLLKQVLASRIPASPAGGDWKSEQMAHLKMMRNAFIMACSKGNQAATLLLADQMKSSLRDEDFLMKEVLQPECRRHEDIVGYIVDLAGASTVQLSSGDQQWLELFRKRRLEADAVQDIVNQQSFLAECKKGPIVCMGLLPNLEKTLHQETLSLAVQSANFWAVQTFLSQPTSNLKIHKLLEDYLGTDNPDFATMAILLEYSPEFDFETMLELITKQDGARSLLPIFFGQHKDLSLISACTKGYQNAAYHLSRRVKSDILFEAYLKATYGRHEDIVEYFLRTGLQGPDELATLALHGPDDLGEEESSFQFSSDDRQWMEELIKRRGLEFPKHVGERVNPYAIKKSTT